MAAINLEPVSDYDNIPERDGVQAGCSNLDPTASEFTPKPNPGPKSAGTKPANSKKKPRSLPNKSTKHRSAKSSAQSKITSLFPKPRKQKVLSTHVTIENDAPVIEDIGPENGLNDNMPGRPPCSPSVTQSDVCSPVDTSITSDSHKVLDPKTFNRVPLVSLKVAPLDIASEVNDDIPLNISAYRIKYEQAVKENSVLTSQLNILHGELDDKVSTINQQKSEMKRLQNDNDNLRRQLSKHTGMRKFVDATSSRDAVLIAKDKELDILKAKLSHYETHISEVASYLKEGIDVDCSPADNRSYADVTAETPCETSPKPTPSKPKSHKRKKRSKPYVVGLGSSLTSGLGAKLQNRGLDATNFCYPGADLPRLRSRVPHVISSDDQPDQVFLQGGGNDLHNGAPPHLVNIEFEKLISEVRQASPDSQIVLSKIPYRTHDQRLHRKIDRVNEYLDKRGIRGDNVVTIDVRPPFPYFYSQPSVIHFDVDGAQCYGDKVASKLINFQSDLQLNRV